MDAQEKAAIIKRITATLIAIVPPFLAGTITHWAASVVNGKKISWRGRIAIVTGSFGICVLVHQMCVLFKVSRDAEFIYIWLECMCVTPLLNLAYYELGDIIKEMVKSSIQSIVARLGK